MDLCGQWEPRKMFPASFFPVGLCESLWTSVDPLSTASFFPVDLCGSQWTSEDLCGPLWIYVDNGNLLGCITQRGGGWLASFHP